MSKQVHLKFANSETCLVCFFWDYFLLHMDFRRSENQFESEQGVYFLKLSPLLRHKHITLCSGYEQYSFQSSNSETNFSIWTISNMSCLSKGRQASHLLMQVCTAVLIYRTVWGACIISQNWMKLLSPVANYCLREILFVSPLSQNLHFSPRNFWLLWGVAGALTDS